MNYNTKSTIYNLNTIIILWVEDTKILLALAEVTSSRLADDCLYSTDDTERDPAFSVLLILIQIVRDLVLLLNSISSFFPFSPRLHGLPRFKLPISFGFFSFPGFVGVTVVSSFKAKSFLSFLFSKGSNVYLTMSFGRILNDRVRAREGCCGASVA